MSTLRLRLLATLPPASLLLHEGAFAISGGGLRASHGYLELAVPLVAAQAASAAVAAIIAPLLARRGEPREPNRAPLSLAVALIGIFVFQELVEAALLGGGLAGLGAAILRRPGRCRRLALVLAAVLPTLIYGTRAELESAPAPGGPASRRGGHPARGSPPPASERRGPTISPLAFGLARRPPPPAAACR